jgi:peptidyl-tRNA hydrolase, PTH1 family
MQTPIQLIVGLGNPGPEYAHTRHNAGEDFVAALAQQCGEQMVNTPKFFGYAARVTIAERDVRLLVPTTFMNRSGQAVSAIAQFFKIPPEAILVAHDELDLAPGVARLKRGGGHGGHNGLRDIIRALGNNANFARLRIGIGHPGDAKHVSGHVLQKAPIAEHALLEHAVERSLAVIHDIVNGEWDRAMLNLHTRLP